MPVDDYGSLSRLTRPLPRPLGRELALVVSFAGHVRQLVDGRTRAATDRLAELDQLEHDLDAIAAAGDAQTECGRALASVIRARSLPLAPLRDLLCAAREDLATSRYASFGELMVHVRRAANPIGRVALILCDAATPRHLALSDGLCCGLWLTGMLRDVPRDFARGRLYLPLDDLERYRVTEDEIAAGQSTGRWRALMMFQIERTRKMLQAGASLGRNLPGRVGFDARLLILAGERILKKLHATQGDVFTGRPEITKSDWPYLVARALVPSYRP
jgi:squalene synthase HpnC